MKNQNSVSIKNSLWDKIRFHCNFGLIGSNMIKKILIITDDFVHDSHRSGAILIKDLADAININNKFSSIVLAPDVNTHKIKKVLIGELILFFSLHVN